MTFANHFAHGIGRLQEHHPEVLVGLRQRGLMIGLELRDARFGPLMSVGGFRHGLLAIYANHDPSVLQLLPPLLIQNQEVEQILQALDRMLSWLEEAVLA